MSIHRKSLKKAVSLEKETLNLCKNDRIKNIIMIAKSSTVSLFLYVPTKAKKNATEWMITPKDTVIFL
jgi:hypothetical protein